MIAWLAWRTRRTPSEWFDQEPAAILSTLRFIHEQDQQAAREAERG